MTTIHKVEYSINLTGSKLFNVVMFNTAKSFAQIIPVSNLSTEQPPLKYLANWVIIGTKSINKLGSTVEICQLTELHPIYGINSPSIKASGVKCVIAASFARIFYRNAINIGLPIIECPEAAAEIVPGDIVSVDFAAGVITMENAGKSYQAAPFPGFVDGIIESGGLLNSLKARGLGK